MQYDMKKLEKEYKEKSVEECVVLAKKFNEEMVQRGEQLIGLLWYLEKSKRYQEFEGYKQIGFGVFVYETCHITYNRYRELVYAYNWYPKESRELGPQTIQAIRSKVGVTKIPKVLKEIKATAARTKDPLKKRAAINAVIEKHTVSNPKRAKTIEDTKGYWKRKYDALFEKTRMLEKENQELRAQIERQKAPITTFLAIKDKILQQTADDERNRKTASN